MGTLRLGSSVVVPSVMASVNKALPDGYTQLEYIESTGTQYIDTDYFFGDIATETVTIDFMRTGTGAGSILYGTRRGYTNNGYGIQFQDGGNTYIQYGGSDGGIGSNAPGSLDTRYTITQTGPTYNFRDISYTSMGTTPTQSYPLYLFGINNGGSITIPTPMRLYSFVIKDSNNVDKVYLIPAMNHLGVIGLYDIVRDVFLTNAGSGEFTTSVYHEIPTYEVIDGVASKRSIVLHGGEFDSITSIAPYGMSNVFQQEQVSGTAVFTNLAEIDVYGLKEAFSGTFIYGLEIKFPALMSNSFNDTNCFRNMLLNANNCTVHFPSNLQSVIGSWTDVINGFGNSTTTVLFDLPATE